ncbi:hypothetical protein J6590_063282 [Homalodisca vitripennis]|nr:hypothetical protein J6590_063282 [Homalodisca vitripennis]
MKAMVLKNNRVEHNLCLKTCRPSIAMRDLASLRVLFGCVSAQSHHRFWRTIDVLTPLCLPSLHHQLEEIKPSDTDNLKFNSA